MVRSRYVYWCISHQQYVEPGARRELRGQLSCQIVKLNLTLIQRVDFHRLSTWINSKHSSRIHAERGISAGLSLSKGRAASRQRLPADTASATSKPNQDTTAASGCRIGVLSFGRKRGQDDRVTKMVPYHLTVSLLKLISMTSGINLGTRSTPCGQVL